MPPGPTPRGRRPEYCRGRRRGEATAPTWLPRACLQGRHRGRKLAVGHIRNGLVDQGAPQLSEIVTFGLASRKLMVEQRRARRDRDDHLAPEWRADSEFRLAALT